MLELASEAVHDDVQIFDEERILQETQNVVVPKSLVVSVPPIYTIEHVDMHEELDGNVLSLIKGVSLVTQITSSQANTMVSPQVVAAAHEDAVVAAGSATMQPPLTDSAPVVNATLAGNVSHEDVVVSAIATMQPPLTDFAPVVNAPLAGNVSHEDAAFDASFATMQPPFSDPVVAASLAENVSETAPEKHINPRIQHDLDLWQRIKDYDKRRTEEVPFTHVLTRKQKQNLKKKLLDGKRLYHTRARGPSSPQ